MNNKRYFSDTVIEKLQKTQLSTRRRHIVDLVQVRSPQKQPVNQFHESNNSINQKSLKLCLPVVPVRGTDGALVPAAFLLSTVA